MRHRWLPYGPGRWLGGGIDGCASSANRNDREFLEWLRPVHAPRLVLLSKSDKLSRTEQAKTLVATRAALDKAALTSLVQLFSSHNGEGVEEARANWKAGSGIRTDPEPE